ncbi:Staygreen protein [Bacillus freudenreichii]|nr:Staygreen protein [Bacillus freudenreichii]
MEKLEYDQFSVTILPPATAYRPVDGRKYTLIMSTSDSSCHLAIGFKYETTLFNTKSEKVLTAEWKPRLGEYILTGKVYFGSNQKDEALQAAFDQMQTELSKAIQMIVKADEILYSHVPWLLDAPIYIEVDSYDHKYKTIKYFGTPRQHLIRV